VQVVNTYCNASVTKQYNLVPAKGRRHSVAGKVIAGLVSHQPCVRVGGLSNTYMLKGLGGI